MGKLLGLAILGRLLGLFITLVVLLPNVSISVENIFGSLEHLKERKEK
tara:strand:- start:934 stop:1077 length:144 start_codon:yes stop_codon:yes gene_type:complete